MEHTGDVNVTTHTVPNAPPEEPAPPYSTYDRLPRRYSQPPTFNQTNQSTNLYSYTNSTGYPGPPPPLPQGFYPVPQTGFVNPSTSSQATTVVIGQPLPVTGNSNRRTWSSGICDCGDDISICCCGTCCFPCLSCQVSTDMGESFCLPCCVPGWLIVLRTKMRAVQNIAGSVLDDCCTVCFCTPCALCQLAREIQICGRNNQMRIS